MTLLVAKRPIGIHRGLAGAGGGSGVYLPGTSGNYISTPDSVLNSVTGDIDIRVCVKPDTWTSGTWMSKYTTSSTQRCWRLRATGGGAPTLEWTQDGSTIIQKTASAAVSFLAATAGWVRVTLTVNNGTGQNEVRFYTSSDGLTWAQLGTTQTTTGVTYIFDGTGPIELGSSDSGTNVMLAGTIYYAEVRNGIDGPVVVKFDASQVQSSGATTPASINGWTWNGSALYKRDDYVRLPGTSGNYLSFPDTVANSVTGDIDIRAKLSADSWITASQAVIGKWDSASNQRAYLMWVDGNTIKLYISSLGSDTIDLGASAALSFANGQAGWIRAARTVSTGVTVFYTSSDGMTWTALTTTSPTSVGVSTFDSTTPVQIGAQNNGGSTSLLAGNVYYAEVRNGINGPVVASFSAQDNQIQTPWTINGSGWNWEGSSFTGKPGIALSLPGVSGNYVSTPDTAGNSVTGDIDLRAKLNLASWNPGTNQCILAKLFTGDPQRAFIWRLDVGAALDFVWYPTGSNASVISKPSNVAIPATSTIMWVRSTLTVATGQVAHYTSLDGVAWTPLGTLPSAVGATSMIDSSDALSLGARSGGTSEFLTGTIYYAEVRNGIDGPIVAKFDATNLARTGTRTPASTVQPGGTPNLLTPNQASIETDATGWVTGTGAPTLARTTAAGTFLDGVAGLSLTATAVGPAAIGAETTAVTVAPVVVNKLYTGRCSFKAATTTQLCKVGIHWYTAASASISTSFGTAVTNSTSVWTEATVTALAPATAAYGVVQIEVAGTVITEVHYVDRISLVEAAEVWTLAGSAWDLVAV